MKKSHVAIAAGIILFCLFVAYLTYSASSGRRLGASKVLADGYDNMLLTDKNGNMKTLLFPAKIIVLWSGTISEIPDGWALCDGTKGTPDLRGRFVIGTNPNANKNNDLSIYEMGSVGGAEVVALSVDQIPNHSHPVSGNVARWQEGGGKGPGTDRWYDGQPVTTGGVGGNQPHENRPPYYTLAYIMKLPDTM